MPQETQMKEQARAAFIRAGGSSEEFNEEWPSIRRDAQRTAAAQAAVQPMNANQALGQAMKKFSRRNEISPGPDMTEQARGIVGIPPRKRK